MAKRIIDSDLWKDSKWESIGDNYIRYMWLYLLTCSHSNSCGVFHLPLKYACVDTNLTIDQVKSFLKVLQEKKLCIYDYDNEEIAIFNYPKYNVRNSGKPVLDMLKGGLQTVKNKTLIRAVYISLKQYAETLCDEQKKYDIEKILGVYEFFIKEKTIIKEKELVSSSNTNNYIKIKSDTLDDTLDDATEIPMESSDDAWEHLWNEIDNERKYKR